MKNHAGKIVVVGAGIGGLAAALRLAHKGFDVTVLEAMDHPGGKMRTVETTAGPADAGPTVLTLRPVFETLFAEVGEALGDYLSLTPLKTLARHFWDDGAVLDLSHDPERSAANIRATFGPKAETEFRRFSARAARLFKAFDAPMMQAPAPTQSAMVACVMRQPGLILDMAPWQTLGTLMRRSFSDPRLAQLFARYATYVGGTPCASPALLSLIWEAEARGVWAVEGGMHSLARAIEGLAKARGAVFHYATPVTRIEIQDGRATAVYTREGRVPADAVLFNGDPRALVEGCLGPGPANAVPRHAVEPRSLSAHVHAFAATVAPGGPELAYHTLFFAADPRAEFRAAARGEMPPDATLYICAQDRATGIPEGPERFEIIRNAPPLSPDATHSSDKEIEQCQRLVFDRLAQFGLRFRPTPQPEALTTPHMFDQMFPASLGSLYGRSPHGLTAGLKRPTARTALPGLYLCGGGAHPGAGVPMATLSARHAAEAIATDLSSTSTYRQTAMRGGMSTGSATAAPVPSASSDS